MAKRYVLFLAFIIIICFAILGEKEGVLKNIFVLFFAILSISPVLSEDDRILEITGISINKEVFNSWSFLVYDDSISFMTENYEFAIIKSQYLGDDPRFRDPLAIIDIQEFATLSKIIIEPILVDIAGIQSSVFTIQMLIENRPIGRIWTIPLDNFYVTILYFIPADEVFDEKILEAINQITFS